MPLGTQGSPSLGWQSWPKAAFLQSLVSGAWISLWNPENTAWWARLFSQIRRRVKNDKNWPKNRSLVVSNQLFLVDLFVSFTWKPMLTQIFIMINLRMADPTESRGRLYVSQGRRGSSLCRYSSYEVSQEGSVYMVKWLLIRRVYERGPRKLCPAGAATPDFGRGRK